MANDTSPWTGDFSLRNFQLPGTVVDSLREHRDRCDQEAERLRVRDINARLAEARKESSEESPKQPLVWQAKFDPKSRQQPLLKILSRQDVDALFALEQEGARSCEPGDAKRTEALCKALAARGEYRRLGQVPTGWEVQLDALEDQFPNFSAIIHYIRAMFNLSMSTSLEAPYFAVPSLDPILIDGPPGVGKSLFSQSIAEMLGVPYRRHDFGSMQTNGELVGSDAMWSNAKIGGVFKVLTETDFANPVLLLDELDKTPKEQRYNPESSLLALLERSTSTCFHDLSIPDIPLDASRITWIATSNDKSEISSPLRSRFRIFEVGPIPEAQIEQFVSKVFAGVVDEMRVPFEKNLQPKVLSQTSALAPRALRCVLREALAYALLEKRDVLLEIDLDNAIQSRRSRQQTRIGF